MKCQNLLPVVAGVVLFASVSALAGNVRVIANPSIKAEGLSASEIKSVFLGERNSLRDGTHVEPVLSKGGPAHEAFLKEYLGKSDDCPAELLQHSGVHGQGLNAEDPTI